MRLNRIEIFISHINAEKKREIKEKEFQERQKRYRERIL